MPSLAEIIALIVQYKYALLFPIAVVEGPIISILGGFLASADHLNYYAVFGVVLLGDLVADTIYYALGRFGGISVVRKYGRYLRISDSQVAKLESHFQKHAGKTLFAAKFAHGLGSVTLFAAGMGRVPYRKFMILNLLSASLKSAALVMVGYYFGYAYQRINDYLNYTAILLISLAVILVVGYIMVIRRLRRELL